MKTDAGRRKAGRWEVVEERQLVGNGQRRKQLEGSSKKGQLQRSWEEKKTGRRKRQLKNGRHKEEGREENR
jgi:hypothetical protein